MQKAISWFCLSYFSAGEGHNVFLLQPKPALAGGASLQLHVLLVGDRGSGEPDSTSAHHPAEQGGSAVPKVLETLTVP